jgi:hypothetical protein
VQITDIYLHLTSRLRSESTSLLEIEWPSCRVTGSLGDLIYALLRGDLTFKRGDSLAED